MEEKRNNKNEVPLKNKQKTFGGHFSHTPFLWKKVGLIGTKCQFSGRA